MRKQHWTQAKSWTMNSIRLAIFWGTIAWAEAGDVGTSSCNISLPWIVLKSDYTDVSDTVFESLFQCPGDLNGCGDRTLLTCQQATYMRTCSCASNCRVYRDCCWETGIDDSEADFPESRCVVVDLYESVRRFLYMVTGCLPSWPNDDVREACEKPGQFNETFYQIPVTSPSDITYKNGYCALCNYDLVNATFWNATVRPSSTKAYLQLPDIITNQPYLHVRPCGDSPNDTCPDGTPESIVKKCKSFYAPVTVSKDPDSSVYRNVYCAMCNGVDLSTLSCKPAEQLSNFTISSLHQGHQHRPGPNLVPIFQPVLRTENCYVQHGRRCFIKSRPKLFRRRHDADSTNQTTWRHQPRHHFTVQNYFTIVCVSFSICCLFLKVVVFSIYKDARNFSSKCTLCLSITLLITQLVFLFMFSFKFSGAVCTASYIFVHYGFLSTFFWTSVLSFDIWRGVTAAKLSSTRKRTLVLYSVVAWGAPMIIVTVAAMVHWLAPTSVLSPLYDNSSCWMGSIWAEIAYFLAPLAVLLVIGVVFYLNTVFYIRKTTGRARDFEFKDGIQQNQHSHIALYVRLALIMGATQGLGILGAFVDFIVIDILDIVLVGSQGAFLFFAFNDHKHLCSSISKRKISSSAVGQSNETFSTEVGR
ncbi:uncharacterized protein LOC8043295 [Ixodes scapularis]|uniref:uncharacterized protein LOC8043295 n=1 Tax=Ixodes scapularis TaxID=6945 RepID=UPI001A9F5E36|nr:uncharacterized protein LOC8043295 [Ixodes scapularis]